MIKKIDSVRFRRFGWVIEYPRKSQYKSKNPKSKNLFRIVAREKDRVGWRIAYLVVRDKAITRLEQHIETLESFEPVCGETLLYVSDERKASRIECFYLDRPVILKKGIWHGVVTLGRDSEIKIAENFKVKCIYWRLGRDLNSKGSPQKTPSL